MKKVIEIIQSRKREAFWVLGFSILPLFFGSGLVLFVIRNSEIFRNLSFLNWLFIFFLLALPVAFSLIPNTLAGLIAGYFLGWFGLAGMTISFSIACLIGFFLGRLSGKGFLEDVRRQWPSIEGILARFRTRPLSLAFSLRLMPAPPFAIGSLILTWLGLPLKAVLLGSISGMIPRMALVVWLGHLAGDLRKILQEPSGDFRLSIALTMFAGFGILIFYLRFLRKTE